MSLPSLSIVTAVTRFIIYLPAWTNQKNSLNFSPDFSPIAVSNFLNTICIHTFYFVCSDLMRTSKEVAKPLEIDKYEAKELVFTTFKFVPQPFHLILLVVNCLVWSSSFH